ncbi:MAG TPA: nuclear transport factor 2 family protein [Solirubrobacteraceae bacterium]|jgi:ketosteroid isomerase-like protein|nr:nuclear transport factor 2 family protein [Solirubrobacteraceae bacterium]
MGDRVAEARANIDAFNRRDVDAIVATFAANVEWWPLRSATEGPYRGHDGIRDWFADTAEQFEYMRATVDEVREEGDAVVLSGELRVKGRQSGASIDQPITWIFRYAGDKVVWGKSYSDPDEAAADLGPHDTSG